jgi:hypothetical protein
VFVAITQTKRDDGNTVWLGWGQRIKCKLRGNRPGLMQQAWDAAHVVRFFEFTNDEMRHVGP